MRIPWGGVKNPWLEQDLVERARLAGNNAQSTFAEGVTDEIDTSAAVLGWRGWRLNLYGELESLWTRYVWNEMERNKALHYERGYSGAFRPSYVHVAPTRGCYCGFWGVKNLPTLMTVLEDVKVGDQAVAFGRISMWGRIIESEYGWRSEYAYPYELWVGKDFIESVRKTYGVDVSDVDDLMKMREEVAA